MEEAELIYEDGQAFVKINIVDDSDPSGEATAVIPQEYYEKVLSGEYSLSKIIDDDGKPQFIIVPNQGEEINDSIDTLNKVINNTTNLHSIDQNQGDHMEVIQGNQGYSDSLQPGIPNENNYTIMELPTDSMNLYKILITNYLGETVCEKDGILNETLNIEFSGNSFEYTVLGLDKGVPRQTILAIDTDEKDDLELTERRGLMPGVDKSDDIKDTEEGVEEFRITEETVIFENVQKQLVTLTHKDGVVLDKKHGFKDECVKLQGLNQAFEYTIQEDFSQEPCITSFLVNTNGADPSDMEGMGATVDTETNIDPAENWNPSELTKEEYSVIREQARGVAALLEANNDIPSIEPYSDQLGSKTAYDDMLDLVERYKSRAEERRSDLISLRKHSKLFIPMKVSARKLTRAEWATNEAAAQVCRYIPSLLFHKRKLFECAATIIENTHLFPNDTPLRQGDDVGDSIDTRNYSHNSSMAQVQSGLDDGNGGGSMNVGRYNQMMGEVGQGQSYMSNDVNAFGPNYQNFGKRDLQLNSSEEISIKNAAERLQEELYQYPLKAENECNAVENQIREEIPKLQTMLKGSTSEIEQAHEYLRETSAVNGRFLPPQRARAQPLSPYDVAVNEAAYHLVKDNIGLLTYRKVLSDLAKKVVRATGCNFRHTSMSDKNFRDYNTSNLWLYNQENIPELDLTSAVRVLEDSLENGPMNSLIGQTFVPVIEETFVTDPNEDEEDEIYAPKEFIEQELFGQILSTCEASNNVLDECAIYCHTGTDDLKKVRILNFMNFSFTSIKPMDINQCYNLVELNLYNNSISYLPRCLFLPNLSKLNLAKNRFITVPLLEQFPKLYSIEIDEKIVQRLNMESLAFFCTELMYINNRRFEGIVSDELNAILVDARTSIESMVQARFEEDLIMYFKKGVAKSEAQKVVETLVLGVRERKIYNEDKFLNFKDLIARKVAETFLDSKIIDDDEDDDITISGGGVNKEKLSSIEDVDDEIDDDICDGDDGEFKRPREISTYNNKSINSKRNEFENQLVENGQILLNDEPVDRLTNVVGQALRSGKTVVYSVMRTAARQPGGDLIPVGGCDNNDNNTTVAGASSYLMNKKNTEITNATDTNEENLPPTPPSKPQEKKEKRRIGPASFKRRMYGIDSVEKDDLETSNQQKSTPSQNTPITTTSTTNKTNANTKDSLSNNSITRIIEELYEMVDEFMKKKFRNKRNSVVAPLCVKQNTSNKENYEKKLTQFKMPKTLTDISRDTVPNLANIPTVVSTQDNSSKSKAPRQKEYSQDELSKRISDIVKECTEPIPPSKMRELLGLDKRGRSSKQIKYGSDLTYEKHNVPIPETFPSTTTTSTGNVDVYSPSKSVLVASNTPEKPLSTNKQFNTRDSNKFKKFSVYGDDNFITEGNDDGAFELIENAEPGTEVPKDDVEYEPASKISKTDSSPSKSSMGDINSESSFINEARRKQREQQLKQLQLRGEKVELPTSAVFLQPDYTKISGLSHITPGAIADYDPLHFIRCHARDNDPRDCNTKVWRCAFEPHTKNPYSETTSVVATCGGECVCLIDCRTGKVMKRFKSREEEFYTVAWTTVEMAAGHHINILAAAGKSKDIRLLHPEQLVCYSEMKGHLSEIACMTFHPRYPTVLFSGDAAATIIVWDIGIPSAPEYTSTYQLLARLVCPRAHLNPILNLVVMAQHDALIAGCEDGVFVWTFPEFRKYANDEVRTPDFEVKVPTHQEPCFDGLARLTDNTILVKCVEEGEIFSINFAQIMQHYRARKFDEHHRIQAEILVRMRWQITDEIYINVSSQTSLASVCCGDNEGTIWLYDMSKQVYEEAQGIGLKKLNTKPVKLLEWPECSVENNDNENGENNKEDGTTKNPIINCVEMSSDGKYLVAVTDNNLVCIWSIPS